MTSTAHQALSIFLPKGALEWFDITAVHTNDLETQITLEERNIPPLVGKHHGKHVISKGFRDISIEDFPIRGRKAVLIFRRRYWEVEDEKNLLKRDIHLTAPGTKIEKEFADFLKEVHRDTGSTYQDYCQLFPGKQ